MYASDAKHRVDLGKLAEYLVAITLGKTAGNDYFFDEDGNIQPIL